MRDCRYERQCSPIKRRVNVLTFVKDSGVIWIKAVLELFLSEPLKMIPGNSTGFVEIVLSRECCQLITSLITLTEETLCTGDYQ